MWLYHTVHLGLGGRITVKQQKERTAHQAFPLLPTVTRFPTSQGSTCLYVKELSDFSLRIWHLLRSPQSYDSNFMTKKIKTNSGVLYNAKHRISSSLSSTICFDLNSMFHDYSIFVLLFICNHRGQNSQTIMLKSRNKSSCFPTYCISLEVQSISACDYWVTGMPHRRVALSREQAHQ